MKSPRRRCQTLAAVPAILTVVSTVLMPSGHGAWSQTAPAIRIVVPTTPGSPADVLVRLLVEEIGRLQGQTLVVENRPGGSMTIGTEAVARAAPDGSTLLTATTAFVINPHLRQVGYDPLTSFEPICNLTSSPTVIVVNAASPYRSLAELLDAARARPGAVTVAGVGPASTVHIAVEMLKRAANVNMTFVPYAGAHPAIATLLGGHVTSAFVPYPAVAEHVKAGKLRALATSAQTRIDPLPDVPTVAESGYRSYEMDVWFGIVAPAKTPKEAVARLVGWFTAALHAPEIKAKLAIQGLYPVGMCGADFAAFLRKQYDEYGRIIREANIKAE